MEDDLLEEVKDNLEQLRAKSENPRTEIARGYLSHTA